VRDPSYDCLTLVSSQIPLPHGKTWETVTCGDLASPAGEPAVQHLQGYPHCCGSFEKIRCLDADGNVVCKSDENWRDIDGDDCTGYDQNPGWCEDPEYYASGGIDASDVCCSCGGSASREVPTSLCGTEDAECDDGNPSNGDGCSVQCTFECGFYTSDGLTFASACGDGVLAGDEQCDDGNGDDWDGCSAMCGMEDGYECFNTACDVSTCVEVCGNGVMSTNEECDDGNVEDGDGCSSSCTIE